MDPFRSFAHRWRTASSSSYTPLPTSSSSSGSVSSTNKRPSQLTPNKLCALFLILLLLLTPFTLTLFNRRSRGPKSARLLRDPVWRTKPWTLPPEAFPKVLVAPDPDWAPKPPRLSGPYPLLHEGPFPSSFACDDISHPFDSSQDADRNSPLVLIGIFTMAHKRSVRDLIRKVEMPSYSGSSSSSSSNANETEHTHGDMGIPRGAVEMKFIVGLPKGVRAAAAKGVADPKLQNSQNGQDGRNGQNGQNGAFARQLIPRFWNTQQDPSEEDQAESVKIMDALHKENATYGDIVLLDIEENMESGKTYAFYRWLSETRSTHRPPRWAMKTDDDSFLILPNILRSLSSFNCAQNIYWGNSWGCAQEFKYHHGGLGYAISWPLVKWLGSTRVRLPVDQVDQNEDARVGTWLAELDPVKEPLITVDYSVMMGSWSDDVTFPKTTDTLILHYMKDEATYREQASRASRIFADASKPYRWEGGAAWAAERKRASARARARNGARSLELA